MFHSEDTLATQNVFSSYQPLCGQGLTFQIPGPCFSTGGYETVEREEEASEVHGHDGLDQSCDLTPADPLLNSTVHSSVSLRYTSHFFEFLYMPFTFMGFSFSINHLDSCNTTLCIIYILMFLCLMALSRNPV